jgi:hypothetical protein
MILLIERNVDDVVTIARVDIEQVSRSRVVVVVCILN